MFKCVFLSGETAAAYLASCYNLIARHLKTAPTFPPRTLFHLFISFATPKAKKTPKGTGGTQDEAFKFIIMLDPLDSVGMKTLQVKRRT